MKYLLDTSWAVHYLRGAKRIVEKLLELKEEGFAASIVTLAELYEGVYRSSDPEKDEWALKNLLTGVSLLGINEETCKIFGRERARLHKKGTPIGDIDLIIASTCLQYNLVLLTDNLGEFERVGNIKIFRFNKI